MVAMQISCVCVSVCLCRAVQVNQNGKTVEWNGTNENLHCFSISGLKVVLLGTATLDLDGIRRNSMK